MNNKTYDILKYIALIILPALATLILTLAGIWGIPYGEAIAATITALDVFLGAILGVSSAKYAAGEAIINNMVINELERLEDALKKTIEENEKEEGE